VELLDLHVRRIERHNPTLNAIVTPDFDTARAAADAARAQGDDRPLLGLPLTVKDSIDVAGLRGTAGVPAFADRRPAADTPVVARARAAGAVIMGKTNVPPWTAAWQASNPIFGRTVNPWDHRLTPGGSTEGGAAALATGLTPLERWLLPIRSARHAQRRFRHVSGGSASHVRAATRSRRSHALDQRSTARRYGRGARDPR
jgi:amidase